MRAWGPGYGGLSHKSLYMCAERAYLGKDVLYNARRGRQRLGNSKPFNERGACTPEKTQQEEKHD